MATRLTVEKAQQRQQVQQQTRLTVAAATQKQEQAARVEALPNLSLQAAKAGLQTGSTPISGAAVDRFFPAAAPSLREEEALRAEVRARSGSPAPLPTARPSTGLMLPTGAALRQERAEPRKLDTLPSTFDVAPAGGQDNSTAFDIDPATVGTRAEYVPGPTGLARFGLGLKSIGQGIAGTPGVVYETGKQMVADTVENQANLKSARTNARAQEIRDELSRLAGQMDYIERYKYPTRQAGRSSREYQELMAQRKRLLDELGAAPVRTPVDMSAPGMKLYGEAIKTREEALEGLTGAGRWLGEQAISIGQNLALLPTAAINPAIPLSAMGAMAGADKMYELSQRGEPADEAFARGVVSGAIEAATEKIPLDALMDVVKTGGRSALKNLLKQAGVEAGEESLSYVMNYIADKAARDPNASFSLSELANSAAGGAFSGLVLGGLGTAANRFQSLPMFDQRQVETFPEVQRPAVEPLPDVGTPVTPGAAQDGANVQTADHRLPPVQQTQKNTSTGEAGKINPGARPTIRETVGSMPRAEYQVPHISLPAEAMLDTNGAQITANKIPAAIRKYMLRLFRGKVLNIGNDHKVYIDKGGIEEFAFPVRRMDGELKTAKMTAGANLDATLEPAAFLLNTADDGHHPEATGGWDNFYVMFRTDTGTYSGVVKTKVTERGRVFHDITEIQKEGDPSTRGVNGINPPPARTGSPGYGSTGQVLNMPQNGPQLTPEAPHGANLSISAPIIADSSAGGNTQSAPNAGGISVADARGGLSLDEFLGLRGLRAPISDYMDDKLRIPHGETARQKAQREKSAASAADDYAARRRAAIQEYEEKVRSGEITPKSTVDRLMATAHGHEDNASTQAARMALEKRGIDWRAAQAGPESSVGAAKMGFDPYSNLQNQKSEFHKEGERAYRQVDVPTTDLNDQRIPKSAATVMESRNITDEAVMEVQRQVADGTLSFTRNTDKGAMAKAEQTVRELGWDGAVERFHQEARRGVVSKDNMALGATLLVHSAQNGDIKTFAGLLTDYTSMSRAGAQATQANRLLKKLSPEGQLYGVQRSIGNLQEELNRRYGDDKAPQIEVDPELMAEFTAAVDQAERDAAMEKIWQNVADQVPATWKDKWDAWRYLSMLGNPRTHIRNIAGNAAFMPVRLMKDAVAWAGEGIADKVLPGGIKRTKSPLNLTSESDRALLRSAFQDAAGQRDSILGQGKFNDDPMSQIRDRQTVFGVKPLEAVRKANSKALDVEDAWFSTPAYAGALAGYLKANHVTLETVSPSLLDDARAYAVREAQRATYRDSNALSDFVAGLRYRGKNPVGRGANLLMEGVLPFRRTPANILMRGVEYSPVGLVKGLTYDLAQVHNGKLSAAEAIDNIAAGLTGTGLLALGTFMAAQGWVTGGSGDDEQAELDNLTGEQPYAVTIGSHSYTLDWMAPEALPFFVGVELYNNLADNGTRSGRAMNDIISSLSSLTEPMLEMSMLQGLQDAIDSVAYSENKLAGLIASSVTGYLSQGLPTIFGQAERTGERQRETTFVDRTSPLSNGLQRGLGRTMNKLPGDFQQIPYIDGWGRTESSGKLLPRAAGNFLAPWYSSQKNVTEADKEIQRLLDAGQSGVVAKRTPQNVEVTYKENPKNETNQKRYLNAEEYVTYATVKGQTSYDLVMDMINSDEYRSMTDEQKADAIKLAYTYAGHMAAEEVTGGKHESEEYVDLAQAAKKELGLYEAEYLLLCEKYGKGVMNGDGIREAYQNGIAPEDYLTYAGALKAVKADKEAKTGKAPGSTSQVDSARALLRDSSLTDEERAVLWSLEGGKDEEGEAKWKESSNPFGERAAAIRKQFDLDVETFLDALEIYRGKGKAADKKAALRELIGQQGNALYNQLGKD